MRRPTRTLRLAAAFLVGTGLVLVTTPANTAGTTTEDAFAPAPHGHVNVEMRDPFVIASYNVLGYAHTPPGSGYEDGRVRMRAAVRKLLGHGVDVVGLQEFERPQKEVFLEEVNNTWGVYSDDRITRDSIAWRKSQFQLVRGETVLIPYFYGKLKPMPLVLLRSLDSGQRFYVANFHLPANSRRTGDEEVWRDEGTRRHIKLAHRLRDEGVPVLFTGDMNEREEYFCKLTRNGDMHAANGGSHVGGVCQPPRPPNWPRIDWIFGSTGIDFSGYIADESTKTSGISDHPMIVARVS